MTTHLPITNTIATLQARIAALKKYSATYASLLIDGQAHALTAIQATYQQNLDDLVQIAAARGALQNLLLQSKPHAAAREALEPGLHAWVVVTFGATSQAAIDFAYPAPKPRKGPTAKVKALAAVKSAATRTARGTKGKKQRKAITATASVAVPAAGTAGAQAAAPTLTKP